MLVPMSLARPEKARTYALLCTITSVLGGIVGYAIGALLYDSVGSWLIQLYGYYSKMQGATAFFQKWGALFSCNYFKTGYRIFISWRSLGLLVMRSSMRS